MNPWDVFTWVSAVALAASGVVIFGFFLRDVGGILKMESRDDDEPESEN
jgi:hypothetical protein